MSKHTDRQRIICRFYVSLRLLKKSSTMLWIVYQATNLTRACLPSSQRCFDDFETARSQLRHGKPQEGLFTSGKLTCGIIMTAKLGKTANKVLEIVPVSCRETSWNLAPSWIVFRIALLGNLECCKLNHVNVKWGRWREKRIRNKMKFSFTKRTSMLTR